MVVWFGIVLYDLFEDGIEGDLLEVVIVVVVFDVV